ncbi:TraR/DksA family transcriptional regulator [Pseudotabrizicola alkalilacus]|uniref:TraR/DksA family transcriptional regulator n=1 Tax=Pseudotabrizicola alkalilacus TaxID=2305252 RepID=A0A411Z1I0_9RHOB|nr:TraR/DksA family transcriptional regulator [Pseudotabrizicola alkalilacus]RGP36892.1 TraR/DksA family transcriptional regulator [Pseudotabrizicola alkalilacus]
MRKSPADRKAQLLARRAALAERMTSIEVELDSHQNRDWEELATERESDEVLEGMGVAALAELRMIDAALVRVDAGTYGQCARCGAEIGDQRLDVLPFTPFCRDCAALSD